MCREVIATLRILPGESIELIDRRRAQFAQKPANVARGAKRTFSASIHPQNVRQYKHSDENYVSHELVIWHSISVLPPLLVVGLEVGSHLARCKLRVPLLRPARSETWVLHSVYQHLQQDSVL